MEFILKKAGPAYLNILPKMINSKDHLGMTPLYLLCQYGAQISETEIKFKVKDRKEMLKLLIEGDEHVRDIEDLKERKKYLASWQFQSKAVKYSPLHWLACLDDVESVKYLLSTIKGSDLNHVVNNVMSFDLNEATPLDLAAKNDSIRTALEIIDYFTNNFDLVLCEFHEKTKKTQSNDSSGFEKWRKIVEFLEPEDPWVIKYWNAK